MEKKNFNDLKSGEGCYVPENSPNEQHLIGRRVRKLIGNRERKLIEDKGAAVPVEALAAPVSPKKRGWFGWWACAFLAAAVIGVCLFLATKDSKTDMRRNAVAQSEVTAPAGKSGMVNISSGANGNFAVIKKVNDDSLVSGVTDNVTGVYAADNSGDVVEEVQLDETVVTASSPSGKTSGLNAGTGESPELTAYIYGIPVATDASINEASADAVAVDYVYFFGNDKSAVADNEILDEIAGKAKKTGADITVTAYASEVGSQAYNMQLSEQRAENLADYLIAHGVPSDHIKIKAAGATDRYGDYSHNRRADIFVNYAG